MMTLRKLTAKLSLGLTLALYFSCTGDEQPTFEPPKQSTEIGKAHLWLTTGDRSKLLTRESDLSVTESKETQLPTISISPQDKMQEIEGFGAALTGSSAYLMNQRMSSSQRQQLIRELFDPEQGIGISYLRMTVGASDFSLSDYTYNDLAAGESDYSLNRFSIAKDKEDVVPVFKQILQAYPNISIMGSPWSPPAWMKTNGSLIGGRLKVEAYEVYAEYFVKYIKAFEEEQIPIKAITVQNEPLHFTAGYPCMEMTASEQQVFIRDHLGPKFASENLNTKIILYDHNWDNTTYPISIMNDPQTKSFVSGSAFHGYGGQVGAMSLVHQAHPDMGLYFTEISGGEWSTNFSDNLQWNISNIFIGATANWSKNVLMWNLALDQNFGPKNNGCQDCRGVVTINSGTGAVTKNVEYYSIGHFAKFVSPGSFRIKSETQGNMNGINQVAFETPSGDKVLVIANDLSTSKEIVVKESSKEIQYNIPSKSVITLIWK
ncbi:glucan endo-1,6-beta-glucosidase [Belliella sp. DSM 111904]|uniref:Glucan endo-1,6-beta-glucosidase n=1 Tax=Belliella filtrata TaxID=2923435 RepID=A0ABS9UXH5_9BACT|nr:glycoside hydrolase family 30 beta sandwich domain-containing protein [Belliella filtrata]MCH7408814.1 glucan endo-1,6-beta-glucosidase [Belliella filtrata]